MNRLLVTVTVLAALAGGGAAFYLPGVAPHEYQPHERVEMRVNKLWSTRTQLPFDYYALPFCKPDKVVMAGENLGEVLSGDRIGSSAYKLYMKENKDCVVLCRAVYDQGQMRQFAERIDEDYRVDWMIDNLPGAIRMVDENNPSDVRYDRGFTLGSSFPAADGKGTVHYINNHIRFVLLVNEERPTRGFRVVGFEVEPFSVKHKYQGEWDDEHTQLLTCNDKRHVDMSTEKQTVDSAGEVIWSYDVRWVDSDIKWTSRWDLYLKGNPDDQIHWFSIVNSLIIVLFLTGLVAMILTRTLRRDIARYNAELSLEEAQEETGWKLVHSDVFRPPVFSPLLLSVFVGSGVQVLMMTATVMVFAVLGFLSPANRGGLVTAMLLLFVFMGMFAGFHSARLYKMFGGKKWKRNTTLTATLFPGTLFSVGFVLNFFVWGEGSSGAIPFSSMFALLLLWFGISVPLVFTGAYFGFKKDTMKPPVRVAQIPRSVPEQAWYLHPALTCLVGGILPFGAVFIELFFIMSSIWLHQIYYVFGFLMIVLFILLATCAEISIVLCYFQLCNEDYHWWWRAFLSSGSSALYLFVYSILYFATKLSITKFVSTLLYFGYMFLVAFTFFLLTGTIGFFACFWFVRTIYGSIKVD